MWTDEADGTQDYLMGTDHIGRDVLSRLIYGARISLLVAGVVLVAGAGIGTILGERNDQGYQKDSKLLDAEVRRCNTYFFENRSKDIIWFYEKSLRKDLSF